MSAKPVTGFRGAMPSERASERAGRYSLTEKEIMKKKKGHGTQVYIPACQRASIPSLHHPPVPRLPSRRDGQGLFGSWTQREALVVEP